eukprot:c19971_g1_i1 orf=930-3260(-)
MKAFLVEDQPPAFHIGISSRSFVTSSCPEQYANHGFLATHLKQEAPSLYESFPSSSPQAMGCITEENGHKGVDCLDNLFCSHHSGIDYMAEMVEKKKHHDGFVRRSISEMGTTEGDDHGHVGDVQASIEAVFKGGAHMGELKAYMSNEGDYGSNLHSPMVCLKGGHLGRLKEYMSHEGNYIADLQASMEALHCNSPVEDNNSFWRFLPSNNDEHAMDFFSCDEFRMYEFKVRRCMRGRSHDWTECPFAHPGEKARRRDPRRFHYSGTACPDFRRGTCRRGDSCELSHGVFECWLHPARYRTQLCKDSKSCKRRVCFFAHSPAQLRFVSPDPVPNSGYARDPALASIPDAMTSYSDVPHKQPPFLARHLSPVRQGSFDGYGANGFFDDFSPKNAPGFPPNGIPDGFSAITGLRNSLNHSKRVPSDGNYDGFCRKNSHSHSQGLLSIDELTNNFQLNSARAHSHSPIPSSDALLVDDCGYQASHGHSYRYAHDIPPPDSSSFKTSQAHVNLRNPLALASLTSNLDQIMSPTSTLIGHALSPPPLSPPLSPSESPPMSPGTPFLSWSTAVSRKMASLSSHPLAFDALSQIPASGINANAMISNGSLPAVNQFQASLLANLAHSNGATMFVSARGPSPLSTNSMGDQTHDFDGLSASLNSKEFMKDESLQTASMEAHPAHGMAHLISTLQQMELRRAVATMDMKNNMRSSYLSQSIPNSPKSRLEAAAQREQWEANGAASPHRVESGQGLRATIYGKLGKELAGCDGENPDLGWVNELVK